MVLRNDRPFLNMLSIFIIMIQFICKLKNSAEILSNNYLPYLTSVNHHRYNLIVLVEICLCFPLQENFSDKILFMHSLNVSEVFYLVLFVYFSCGLIILIFIMFVLCSLSHLGGYWLYIWVILQIDALFFGFAGLMLLAKLFRKKCYRRLTWMKYESV